jgi:hypothetical protein
MSTNATINAAAAGPTTHDDDDMTMRQTSEAIAETSLACMGVLYKDALTSIFAFLDFDDLHSALLVSPSWSAAIRSMPRLDVSLILVTRVPRSLIVQSSVIVRAVAQIAKRLRTRSAASSSADSSLARHIGELRTVESELAVSELARLHIALPNLHTIDVVFVWIGPLPLLCPFHLPCGLRRLKLHEKSMDRRGVGSCQSLVDVLGELNRLEELTLILSRSYDSDLRFGPLVHLRRLHTFTFRWCDGGSEADVELSDEQVAAIRGLPSLTELELFNGYLPAQLLQRLAHQPHTLQWESVNLNWTRLTTAHGVALQSLSSLTSLRPLVFNCTNLDFMRHLPLLAIMHVHVELNPALSQLSESVLISGLQSCHRLTDLSLEAVPLTSAHLTEIFAHLSLLHTLLLSRLEELADFSCFSHGSITRSLNTLQIWGCNHPALQMREMIHLSALSQLSRLEIRGSIVGPLDAPMSALFTPPSSHMPNLSKFDYHPRKASVRFGRRGSVSAQG